MEEEMQDREAVKKLNIDKPLDFRYHAAYVAYSKTWDENPSEETRTMLNEILVALSEEEGSFSDFYNALSQFRKGSEPNSYNRRRIRTQSKRDWKRSEANAARLSRYKR